MWPPAQTHDKTLVVHYTFMQNTHIRHCCWLFGFGGCLLMQKRCSRPSSLGQPS